jgi:hypothetical protein
MNNYRNVYNITLLNDIHFLCPEILYDNVIFPNSEANNIIGWIRYKLTRLYPTTYHRNRIEYLRTLSTVTRNDYDDWGFLLNRQPFTIPSSHRNIIISEPDIIPITPINSNIVQSTTSGLNDLIRLLFNYSGSFEDPVPVFPTTEQINNATEIVSGNEQPENIICTICQSDDTSPSEVMWRTIKSCKHTFHRQCIDRWFTEHSQCPVCRVDIRNTSISRTRIQTNPQTTESEERLSESNQNQ